MFKIWLNHEVALNGWWFPWGVWNFPGFSTLVFIIWFSGCVFFSFIKTGYDFKFLVYYYFCCVCLDTKYAVFGPKNFLFEMGGPKNWLCVSFGGALYFSLSRDLGPVFDFIFLCASYTTKYIYLVCYRRWSYYFICY